MTFDPASAAHRLYALAANEALPLGYRVIHTKRMTR